MIIHYYRSMNNVKGDLARQLHGDRSESRQRPYHVEKTDSHPITEVKQHRAWLVLGWVTAWVHHVPLATDFFFFVYLNFNISLVSAMFWLGYVTFRLG